MRASRIMAREVADQRLERIREWLETAPPGTNVPAESILEFLGQAAPTGSGDGPETTVEAHTWREKLWTVPEETRIGTYEVCEALGRTKSWLYHRTGPSARDRIPHRKLDGELVFMVGDVREWLRRREVRVR